VSGVRAVRERREVSVERVEEPAAPQLRVGAVNDPAELDAERRAAQALSVQRDWEPDLRGVEVHDDAVARRAADSIGAAAFTRGSDIYVGSEYEAGTPHGNHVLAHELAHVEQGHGPDEIHRFPATALSAGPVDWSGETTSVFRPSGGVSGGVYILTSTDTDGGIKKVVVKPIFGASGIGAKETGESLSFGDKALSSLLGISTPTSRPVKGGSAEFAQLVQVCSPHQPAKPEPDTEGADMWQPLSAAKSFVVMGEVPGTSVASLADKAATDPASMNALYRSVLDEDFVADMGRVSVGDILIGNNDRMVAGAMNLGNIMVAMSEGRSKLWAIDTNAVLGKNFNPNEVVKKGSTSSTMQGGFENAKSNLKAGGGRERIEGFYEILIRRMKAADPAKLPGDTGPSAVETFEMYYRASSARLIAAFELGWDTALVDIFALLNTKEGRAKMKSLTDEAKDTEAEDDLSYTALKLNAGYLASKALGDDDDKASEDLGALAAAKYLATFDPTSIMFPADEFHHTAAKIPSGDAYSADLAHPDSLPPAAKISQVKRGIRYDEAKLADIGVGVANAKAELAGLGTKSKGRGKGKKEQPRNRTVAGTFVADTYLVGAGSYRASAAVHRLTELVDSVVLATGGNLKPSNAKAAIPGAKAAVTFTPMLEANLQAYSRVLRDDAKAVGKIKKYDRRADLAGKLTDAAANADDMLARLDKQVKLKNPSMLVEILASKAR